MAVSSASAEPARPAPRPTPSRKQLWLGHRGNTSLSGFDLLHFRHPPDHQLPWHDHELPVLVLVRQGGYRQVTRGRSFDCGAGEVAVVPAAERHREAICRRGADSVLIFPARERAADLARQLPLLDRLGHFRGANLQRLGANLERELRLPDSCSALALEGLILELLATLGRNPEVTATGSPPRWLRQALEVLNARYPEDLRLAELASQVGVSRGHLARGFRAWLGISPATYLRKLRLDHAERSLRASRIPIAEVALAAGFYDQAHLTNAFRHAFGATPAAYRREVRR